MRLVFEGQRGRPREESNNGTSSGVALYYRQNTAAISTAATVENWTVMPTSAEVVLQLHEFTGVVTSAALDADGVASGSSSPAVVTTAGMPSDLTSENMTDTDVRVVHLATTVGHIMSGGNAFAYRVNMSTAAVAGRFSSVTDNINGAAVLVNSHAYFVTDWGALHVLDPTPSVE